MSIVIRYEAGRVLAALGRLQFALSGPGLAQGIQAVMTGPTRDTTEERFLNEGDAIVGQWQDLTPRTIAMRADQGFGPDPINVRTGRMKMWATNGAFATKSMGPAYAHMVYPGSGTSGELEKKVATAQAGDGNRTPARPILSWTPDDLESYLMGMAAWIEGFV